MLNLTARIALLVGALFALGCAPGRQFGSADHAAITSLLDKQAAAWNRGDLDAFMAGYANTPDLVFTSGAKIRRGWEQTRAKYKARYGSDPATMGRLALDVLEVQPLGADGAVVLGRWTLTKTAEAGSGVFTVVFERRTGGWRVVHDHTSADPAE